MSKLRNFVEGERPRLEDMYQRGIEWLTRSEIRNGDGGYKSEYNPLSGEYEIWGGGKDCILNTAGAVLALSNHPSHQGLAIRSAEHLADFTIKTQGNLHGCLRAGVDSEFIFPNYSGWAILAICRAYRVTGREDFLSTANMLAQWLVRNVQQPDGRILDSIRIEQGGFGRQLRDRINKSYSTWQAVLILAIREVLDLSPSKENEYYEFLERLSLWIEKAQREDGAIPFQYWGKASRIYQAFLKGRTSLIRNGWDTIRHPTAAVICYKALLTEGKKEGTGKLLTWLKNAVGPGGLFYQYYWNGNHSIEEDVMPTAYFSRTLLDTNDPDAEIYALRTLKALARSQIASNDPNADGAFKGVPRHPTLGESAFCWDTQFALMLLESILTIT